MSTLYPAIIDRLDDWFTSDWYWMLMIAPFSPDTGSQVFVDDISADEATAPGYSRVLVTNKTITSVFPTEMPQYNQDDPDFGAPSGGQVALYLVLYVEVTDDSDSVLAGAWPTNLNLDGTSQVVRFLPQIGPAGDQNPDMTWLLTGQVNHLNLLESSD